MKYKILITLSFVVFLMMQCSPPTNESKQLKEKMLNKQLPKALYVTTGKNRGNAELAKGIIIAIQTFNKRGTLVRLEPRDILYDYDKLSNYNIIILSTAFEYHDADRKYSLTYMSNEEIHNLTEFVSNGGVLISGDNVGRNLPDGTDRISKYQKLDPENWELSECFGVSLKEKNMAGNRIEGKIGNYFNGVFMQTEKGELWTLVPDTVNSSKLKVLAYWKKANDSMPAIIQNKYNKGTAYLFASSDFLHPANDGGYWSAGQIQDFYNYVLDEYNSQNHLDIRLNAWPDAYDYAFCVTLNSSGSLEQYKRIINLLEKENIKPTFFVSGNVNEEIKSYLKDKNIPTESSGFSFINYEYLTYPESVEKILRNENKWNKKFTGFRFPYTSPGFWAILALDENNYSFESSIGANNIDFFHGSVFPYNIVVANDKFYKSTDVLEIAPTYHDDYYFLKKLKDDKSPNLNQLTKDVMLYEKYLQNYWKYAVKPYKGLMVFLGHPEFVGYSDTTSTALKNLITRVKQDNTWITTINEVAEFRKNLEKLQFYVDSENNEYTVQVIGPKNINIKNITLVLSQEPKKVIAKKGKVEVIKNTDDYKIVFEAFDGQVLTIKNE